MKLPEIFGHRGARFTAPENSIPSFINAIKFGAHGIELDVHLTRDGKLVVIHDTTLKRVNGSNELIKNLTLSEIKRLDISHLVKNGRESIHAIVKLFKIDEGKFFVELTNIDTEKTYRYLVETGQKRMNKFKKVIFPRKGTLILEKELLIEDKEREEPFRNVHIPELSEVLDVAKGVKINIEIKRGEKFYPGIIDKLIRETEQFGYENILFSSFNYETLLEMKRRYPFVKANRLYEVPRNALKASEGVDGVNPFFLLVSRRNIVMLQNRGKTVYPWVVNKANSIMWLSVRGVNGIITDRPFYAVQIRKAIGEVLNEI